MPTTYTKIDPLRGSACSRCKNPWFFAISNLLATLCGDRRGRGAKTHGFFPISNLLARPSAKIGVVEVQKPMVFFAISAVLARPSAGIGVVEVQKPMVFCDFCGARATLCGDRRGRGAKTNGFFAISNLLARPSAGIGVVEVQKPMVFFAISAVLAQPSVGIGVVEVQKLKVFCDFCCSNWSSGVVSWFARLLPKPAGRGFDSSLVRGRALQDATCILQQLAQSNLRRASCTEQLAQTNLHRPVCAERLA